MKLIPREKWTLFSHWLIWHGRRRCFARKPDCANCEVSKLCPRIGVALNSLAGISRETAPVTDQASRRSKRTSARRNSTN